MCLQECWLHSLNLFAELQGSSADGVMRIYMDGCLIGENPGAMFGLATYFAENFSTHVKHGQSSMHYSSAVHTC
jgi:hypothetical protein